MEVFVLSFMKQFVIDIDSLTVFTHVVVAIGEPQTVFDLNIDSALAF